MATWLAIDWDQDRLHVLAAQAARGKADVERGASWPLPSALTPASAEQLGRGLREFLRQQQLRPGRVVVTVPRDRLLFKELRLPPVSAAELPGLVRFQLAKDQGEPIDSFVLDHAPLPTAAGDPRVLAVAIKKDLLTALQALCRSAGLKLACVLPRSFALAAALDHAGTPLGMGLQAVLVLPAQGAELSFFRDGVLCQSRPLPTGANVAAEAQRALTVFQAQQPDGLTFAGLQVLSDGEPPQLAIPSERVPPVEQFPAAHAANFALLAGAVAVADRGAAAVDLANPKKAQKQAATPWNRRVQLLVGAAAALVLVVGGLWFTLSRKQAEIRDLTFRKTDLEEQVKLLKPDHQAYETLSDFEMASVPWLDRLYELNAAFPRHVGVRVDQLNANVNPRKSAKDPHLGAVNLTGIVPTDQVKRVHGFREALASSPQFQVHVDRFHQSSIGPNIQQFQVKVDLLKPAAAAAAKGNGT